MPTLEVRRRLRRSREEGGGKREEAGNFFLNREVRSHTIIIDEIVDHLSKCVVFIHISINVISPKNILKTVSDPLDRGFSPSSTQFTWLQKTAEKVGGTLDSRWLKIVVRGTLGTDPNLLLAEWPCLLYRSAGGVLVGELCV